MIRHQIRALKKIWPKPVVLYSTSNSSVELSKYVEERKSTFIQQLTQEFNFSKDVILNLKKHDASNINFDVWKGHMYAMKKCGLEDTQCFKLISEYPFLLEIPLSEFESTIQTWKRTPLKTNHLHVVLMSQPTLLEVDEDVITHRIPQLQLYFNTSGCLTSLLVNCPNVMLDDWEAVLEKIRYLLGRGFKAEDLLQENVLANSLEFIKFRLDLLKKCGIFKEQNLPVHKINKYDKSGHKNPLLKCMLSPVIKKFVQTAKISEEEYLVYEEMFMTHDDDDDDYDGSKAFTTTKVKVNVKKPRT